MEENVYVNTFTIQHFYQPKARGYFLIGVNCSQKSISVSPEHNIEEVIIETVSKHQLKPMQMYAEFQRTRIESRCRKSLHQVS